MRDWQDMICGFHKAKGFSVSTHKIGTDQPAWWIRWLMKICGFMVYRIGKFVLLIDKISERLNCRHFLIFRSHIIIEEVGETIIAVANGDEIETADGIGDSIVVLLGLAVICDLPMNAIINEINRSNMTKEFYDEIGGRKKSIYKGKNYSPPDIERAILIGRALNNLSKASCRCFRNKGGTKC